MRYYFLQMHCRVKILFLGAQFVLNQTDSRNIIFLNNFIFRLYNQLYSLTLFFILSYHVYSQHDKYFLVSRTNIKCQPSPNLPYLILYFSLLANFQYEN